MANDPFSNDDSVRRLINAIKAAYPAEAERPARDSLVTCGCEECAETAEYFGSADRYGNSAETLCRHSAAISLLNLDAFTYWLPAFMIAELEDPEAADVIAPSLRITLSSQEWLGDEVFTVRQRDVIVEFMLECSRRDYEEPIDEQDKSSYRAAAEVVRKWNAA